MSASGWVNAPSLLYLHGFRSSPASWKAGLLRKYLAERGLADRLICPQLSHEPNRAIRQAETLLAQASRPVMLLGSSLGAYYATWLAEKHALRAVLINPAVLAPLALTDYLGVQTHLHDGTSFELTRAHLEELQAMEVLQPTSSRYLLLLEEGDEVLDYRVAVRRYAGCRQIVLPGGDHSFTRFAEYLPQILEFGAL